MGTAPTTSKRAGRAGLIVLAALLLLVGLGLTGAGFSGFGPGAAQAQEAVDAAGPAAPVYRPAPQPGADDYPQIAGVNSRVAVWLAAQLHLWFAAFVLAVPIFVLIIEAIGMATREERYDKMAYEFIKVSITAYSLTAILGGLLLVSLIVFYPDLTRYLAGIFKESMF
jgi:hypothetical protein